MVSRGRLQRALEVAREYAKLSSLHGLRHMAKEGLSVKERVFWFLLVAGLGAGMCSLCIVLWLDNAGSTETVLTNIATSIADEPMPCVAICPSQQIDRESALQILQLAVAAANRSYTYTNNLNLEDWRLFSNASHSREAYRDGDLLVDGHLDQILLDLHHLTDPGIAGDIPFFANTAKMLISLDEVNQVDFMKQVFPSCHTFFHSCLWRGIPFDCCKHFRVRPTDVGYCYFFNDREADRMVCLEAYPDNEAQRAICVDVQKRSMFGPGSGLRVYLKAGSHGPKNSNALVPMLARVTVGASCIATSMSLDENVYAVPAAVYTLSMRYRRIRVHPSITRLPPSARNCLMRYEWPGATAANRKNFPAEYSLLRCVVESRRKHVLNACGCLVYPYSLGDPTSVCAFSKTAECIANVSESLRFFRPPDNTPGFSPEERNKGLMYDCLPRCDRTTFEIDARTPDLTDVDRLKNPAASLANSTMLDLFFASPNAAQLYTVAPTVPPWQMLVTLGAVANLFLGISFLTMLEVIVVFAKCFWILLGFSRESK